MKRTTTIVLFLISFCFVFFNLKLQAETRDNTTNTRPYLNQTCTVLIHGGSYSPLFYKDKGKDSVHNRSQAERIPCHNKRVNDIQNKKETTQIEIIHDQTLNNSVERERVFGIILKTNLLYDIAMIPNIAAEFHLGNNWTIAGQYFHTWLKNDHWKWYWRAYGGDLSFRKYFGGLAKELVASGHHLGVYGQVFTYDIEMRHRGYLGKKPTWGVGLEYGYSLPISKSFNIDFSIALGNWKGEYMEYLPIDDCYVWQNTKMRNYFGPTKLEVTLAWFIGRGFINRKGCREK